MMMYNLVELFANIPSKTAHDTILYSYIYQIRTGPNVMGPTRNINVNTHKKCLCVMFFVNDVYESWSSPLQTSNSTDRTPTVLITRGILNMLRVQCTSSKTLLAEDLRLALLFLINSSFHQRISFLS